MKRKLPINDCQRKQKKTALKYDGNEYFCNQLDKELPTDGRIALEDLIPFSCESALITAFDVNPEWLQEYFHRISSLLIVQHDATRKSKLGSPLIRQNPDRSTWTHLYVKPSGLMHAKLFVFRTHNFVRVVISSANLVSQWQRARDIMWVQDFPLDSGHGFCESEFGSHLRKFCVRLCGSNSFDIGTFLTKLFLDVNFSSANAHLIESWPRQTDHLTGHKRLRDIIADNVHWPSSDDPVTCISGSLGKFGGTSAMNPDFLREMESVFKGEIVASRENAAWEDIKLIHILWPTISTGLESSLDMLFLQKFLNKPQWEKLPHLARLRFYDAVPNFEGVPDVNGEPARPPIHHAKSFLRISKTKNPKRTKAWIYVGSHNFSKAAWGLGKIQPKNVELGVLLETKSEEMRDSWVERFPFRLPVRDATITCYGSSRDIEPFIAGAQFWFADRNDEGRSAWWENRVSKLVTERESLNNPLCETDSNHTV